MTILKNNGWKYVEFITLKEEEIFQYQPVAGSFAVIKCDGKFLVCYNIWRKQWELPAGSREGKETPKDCALRELYEETGQMVSDMEFKGLLKSKNTGSGEFKLNPVYFTTIEKLQPFKENEEISAIKLWDLKEKIGSIDSVDIKILELLSDNKT
ncbi:NUDIX domain-containing protein [Ureibacillus aquaedulcis]|uniref:NUDIX hydrolase n=1 Tax=Ureibacillus aquaedulcis TaxID=3058421 RepID=A0ABT8GQ75_9BACL|nr:NUDIX hydrolase [Ureibacillus sp. BA0131]MDN4493568.1 NUDIX hydrolase [Ureibacillus sp. BA0131]